MSNIKLSLFRGNSSEVAQRSVIDGQLLVDESTPSLYTDVGNSRLLLSQSGSKPQSDWTQSDSSSADYIKNKPTKLSQFNSTYVVYDTTEPTANLVDDKTRWYGGDGKVDLTFINTDGSTYKVLRRAIGATFPTIPDPKVEGYEFDHWSPSLPSIVPNIDTTYTAINDEVNLTFVDYDGTVLEECTNVTPGDTMPTITDPTRTGYRFNGWSPILPTTVPYCDTVYTADYSKQVTLTFMGYEIPQSQYDYHEIYDTIIAYEGDPFPVPVGTPTASSSSPEYSTLQPVFVKWKDTFPQTVPSNDTVYRSEWKNLTSIAFLAVYAIHPNDRADVVPLYPYKPSDYIQYSGYSGVELTSFTPPATVTDSNGVVHYFNNRWLTPEEFTYALGEPTWTAASIEDLYEINPNVSINGITFYMPDYISRTS